MSEGQDIETVVRPPKEENKFLEKNWVEKLNNPFRIFGLVTEKSKVRTRNPQDSDTFHQTDIDRTTALRNVRAELYKEFKQTPKADVEGRKRIISEAHARDEILKQLLKQGEVHINLPSLGEQVSRYTHLTPPEARKSSETEQLPPIFFISSISAGIPQAENLLAELAYSGREVFVVGYPEAGMGKVTQEFAEEVEKSPTYQPHTEFFKQAIDELQKYYKGQETNQDIELWGFSTGATIVAEILNDPKFQERTTNAVLLSPASVVDQSAKSLLLNATVKEGFKLLKRFSRLPRYSFIMGTHEKHDTKEQAKLKDRITKALLGKVARKIDMWKNAKIKDSGSIITVVGEKDPVTKSAKGIEEFNTNPQIKVISLPEGIHDTPVTYPEEVIPKITKAQQNSSNVI